MPIQHSPQHKHSGAAHTCIETTARVVSYRSLAIVEASELLRLGWALTMSEGPGAVGQESKMTIYISQGRYTAAAIRAMTTKPEDRSEAIAELLAAVGGRL